MCGRSGWGEGGKTGTRTFCMESFIFNKSIKINIPLKDHEITAHGPGGKCA